MDQVLATLIVLQHNLRLAHWEIVGPNFIGLHTLLGTQYQELGTFIDRVAEFMRMHGDHAITLSTALNLSKVRELSVSPSRSWEALIASTSNSITVTAKMVQDIDYRVPGQDSLDRSWNKLADDLHEWLTKQAWLLRSHLSSQ